MSTVRERLLALLDALPDEQIETVLHFAEAIRKGRVVVGTCDIPETRADRMPEAAE